MFMETIEKTIEVDAPLHEVYNQWTQFEEFPEFMEGVQKVVQLDDTHLQWTAEIAGRTKTWQARISEQSPDKVVAWEATEGAPNCGIVSFDELGPTVTRVNLVLDYEPDGPVESAGDALGVVDRRVKGDLERFKEFIEGRGTETGGWRGTVQSGRQVGSDTAV